MFIALLLSCILLEACFIRVNQVGYLENDTKVANLFSNQDLDAYYFTVVTVPQGVPVLAWTSVGPKLGAYSGFSNHYKLDFSSITTPGTYRILLSNGKTVSYDFEIGNHIYEAAPATILHFLRAQRCGHNPYLGVNCHMDSGTSRMDAKAVEGPHAGTVFDASGGWHDAGDYIKFMINNANVTFLLLFAYQENPAAFADDYLADGAPGSNGIADVLDEAKYSLDWIMKMHPNPEEFYHQVGDANDHDQWRLPQDDTAYYSTSPYRPMFPCASGRGANVAGKAAAALALASMIWTDLGDTTYGDTCIEHAQQIYEFGLENPQAQASRPPDFYGETTWRDDMELAAVELYKATGINAYLSDAESWAPFVGSAWGWTDWATLNFFAHYELYPQTSSGTLRNQLKQFMQYDLDENVAYASSDMFGMAADYEWGSQALNTAAVLNTYLYKRLFSETTYDSMATAARDYLLGKNQWSICFIVGMGNDYPNYPHHQISEIMGADIAGMPIEGPIAQSSWQSYGAPGPLPEQDPYHVFHSSDAVYYDFMPDYSTNEPTIWQAGLTIAMFSFN